MNNLSLGTLFKIISTCLYNKKTIKEQIKKADYDIKFRHKGFNLKMTTKKLGSLELKLLEDKQKTLRTNKINYYDDKGKKEELYRP